MMLSSIISNSFVVYIFIVLGTHIFSDRDFFNKSKVGAIIIICIYVLWYIFINIL